MDDVDGVSRVDSVDSVGPAVGHVIFTKEIYTACRLCMQHAERDMRKKSYFIIEGGGGGDGAQKEKETWKIEGERVLFYSNKKGFKNRFCK